MESKHEKQLQELESESREQSTLRDALSCLDSFCESIDTNLEGADWTLRREILRTLIDTGEKTLTAEFVKLEGVQLTLRKADEKEIVIPLNKLEDQVVGNLVRPPSNSKG